MVVPSINHLFSAVASTLPHPFATSQGSGSDGTDKSVSLSLIISLTVASVTILVVIFIALLHVRRPRRSPWSVDRGRAQLFKESNVLPAPVSWMTMSPMWVHYSDGLVS